MSLGIDLYPARVVGPGFTHSKVRALAYKGHIWLVKRDGKEYQVLAHGDYSAIVPGDNRLKTPNVVTMDNGETWEVSPAGGCGCSDPMKRLTRSMLMTKIDRALADA